MKPPISVSVIGPGALGSAIIDLVTRHAEFSLHSVWGRSRSFSYSIDSETGQEEPVDHLNPSSDDDLGHLNIIAVPDDKLSILAQQLSEANIKWNQRAVIHLSGSLDSTILKPLKDRGAQTASMHPLQTFTHGDGADRFSGIWFSFQGDDKLFPLLNQLIEPFGSHSKVLTSKQKLAMHVAAVFASNYLVSLMDVVDQIAKEEDISDGLYMLQPIIHQTIDNIIKKGTTQSLSGPVARGDKITIASHLKRLEKSPIYFNLYQQLGLIASQIAQTSGQLDKATSRKIRELFETQSNE